MTKATTAGEVGDVDQFRAEHPTEGLKAAATPGTPGGASTDRVTDDTEITSPGWDAADFPKREQLEAAEDTEDTTAKLIGQAESYVAAHPIRALAAGLVAGVVLGRML